MPHADDSHIAHQFGPSVMFSRLLRHVRIRLRLFNNGLSTKQAWELEWQRQWVRQFSQPAIQQKVHEYWKKFRHLDEVLGIVGAGSDTNILDVGCGISTVLHYLSGERTGIDPLAEHYKRIYSYPPDVSVVASSGERLPFPDGSFNLVFCSNCIDHTTSPPQVIAEILRVLAPQGHLLLTCEVFSKNLGARNDAHPHSMTTETLESLVARFARVKTWESPWYGLQNYVTNAPPTSQQELVLLCQKRIEP
jgi:ubiquinone/menaquinone biosynthesis C-methylase UbiE